MGQATRTEPAPAGYRCKFPLHSTTSTHQGTCLHLPCNAPRHKERGAVFKSGHGKRDMQCKATCPHAKLCEQNGSAHYSQQCALPICGKRAMGGVGWSGVGRGGGSVSGLLHSPLKARQLQRHDRAVANPMLCGTATTAAKRTRRAPIKEGSGLDASSSAVLQILTISPAGVVSRQTDIQPTGLNAWHGTFEPPQLMAWHPLLA